MSWMSRADSQRLKRAVVLVLLGIALVLHARRSVGLFTPSGRVLSEHPLLETDNPMHQYYASLGAELIKRSGQPYGYDPSEMAGHPKTPIFDPGIVALERITATLSFWSPTVVYKLWVLASLLAAALCPLGALWLLGLRGLGLLFSWATVMFLHWWGQGAVFTQGGMNAWLLSLNLAFLMLGATVRLILRWSPSHTAGDVALSGPPFPSPAVRWPRWLLPSLVGLLFTVVPWIHPFGVLSTALCAALLVLLVPRTRQYWQRVVPFVLAAGAVSLLLNFNWLWSTFIHRNIATAFSELIGGAESPLRLLRVATRDIAEAPTTFKRLNRVAMTAFDVWIMGSGLVGLWWLRRRRDPRFLPLLVPLVVLGFLTYFSRDISALQNIQPFRLRLLCLEIAAAIGGLMLAGGLEARGWPLRKVLAVGSGVFACLYFLLFDLRPQALQLRVGYSPIQQSWVDTINAHSNKRGRILIEDGDGYKGMAPSGFKFATDALWFGGPYVLAYITYHRPHYDTGVLLDKPIGGYSEEDLRAVLRRYNINLVMAWSAASKARLDSSPLLHKLQEQGGVTFYAVSDPADSFFERGSGELSVRLDELSVKGAVAPGGSLVLRFHHYDHLRVKGARELRRYDVPDDAIGFIEVVEPGPEFTIFSEHTAHLH